MNELTISLTQTGGVPLYEQIYRYIRQEIEAGRLVCGDKLPSTRSLAAGLDISRNTAELAYEQLLAEGYVEAIPCRGYYVLQIDGLYHQTERPQPLPETGEEEAPAPSFSYDFSPYGIDLDSFPSSLWQRLTRDILLGEKGELFRLGPPQGECGLRESICDYLYHARGVRTDPEHIVIGAGNDYLLMLLSACLRDVYGTGMTVAMEQPTYVRAYRLFQSLGIRVTTVGMDENGILANRLEETGAQIAFVMPSHHFPRGTVMSIGRRTECLRWAMSGPDRYLIEDDYDSEFRYRGKPIPALAGIDRNDRVIYLGTFSKSIAPAIRISYMVLPDTLLVRYRKGVGQAHSTVSRIDQQIVTAFLNRGYFERHLNKMRAIYKNKRDALLSALKEERIPGGVSGDSAGVHLLLDLGSSISEREALELAAKQGVRLYGLSEFFISGPSDSGNTVLLLGYAGLTAEQIKEGIHCLAKAWESLL